MLRYSRMSDDRRSAERGMDDAGWSAAQSRRRERAPTSAQLYWRRLLETGWAMPRWLLVATSMPSSARYDGRSPPPLMRRMR
jgi:hypothetical protein